MKVAQDPRVARLKVFFETLSPAAVERLDEVYVPDARFKDPFNDVTGVPAIRTVFAGMYRQVDRPRFVITRSVCQGDDAFLAWDFLFSFKGDNEGERMIRGATHIQFAADGRVALHRDYWDAAEELYEKLPVLGSLMRWLKRRARH
ncbi:MAG TPA: nuclear transport factor 2 family protein [Burkholderiaceae bacterium]|nr:nuclear transport factor 2 family protein [Burkholderiaceae bacterium]